MACLSLGFQTSFVESRNVSCVGVYNISISQSERVLPANSRLVATVSSSCFFSQIYKLLSVFPWGVFAVEKSRKSKTKHCENVQLAFLWKNKTVFKIQIEYKIQIEKQLSVKLKFCQHFIFSQAGRKPLFVILNKGAQANC